MKIEPSRQLLTVTDTANRLALKEATIRKMILQRRIPIVKIGRADWIPLEEVERIIVDGYQPTLTRYVPGLLNDGKRIISTSA